MMVELLKIASSSLSKWRGAPGTAVNVKGTGVGKTPREAEMAHPPGIFSRPPKGFHGVYIPITSRYGLVVGGLNYAANINISEGETAVYSSDPTTGAVKARLDLDNAGKAALTNDAGKSLKTILETLIEHVRDLTTINCVAGAPVTLSPASIALLNQDIADLGGLLK